MEHGQREADRHLVRGKHGQHSVAFSPNGQTLALGENSGTIVLVDEIVWNWNFTSLKLLLCGEVGTNMTKAQWLANVPDQPYQKTCPTSQ